MRRLVVATRHYAPEPTGSGPVMQLICEWLANEGGFDVEVVTVRPSYPEPVITEGYANGERDRVVENGVKVWRLPTNAAKPGSILRRIVPELRFMLDLYRVRLTGALKPTDRLVSLCPSILTVTAALFLVRRGGRHVAIVHDIPSGLGAALGIGLGASLMRVLRFLEAWSLNRVDHVVVLSEEMGDSLRELGVRTPMTAMPPQVDTDEIRPLPRPAGAPPTLMYSGNLGRKQGLEQLLALAAVLKGEAPDVRILIRGAGAMREPLQEHAAREKLDNVRFEPLVDKALVSQSLAEGDIHLVPQIPGSREFTVPSKAYAIMAAGRPFIATADPGTPLAKLADASQGFICVPPNEPAAYARAALTLLADGERREALGMNGRRYVEAEVAKPVVMRRFMELLD
jgi:colanic acid biosynthesis glycosyl transferase WcaI